MTKWTLRKPDIYQNIPEGGFAPRSGVAMLVAMLLYLIYSCIAAIPALVHAAIILAPRVDEGLSMPELIDTYTSDPSTLPVSLFLTALLILTTVFYIRRIEKRPLATIGLSRGRIVRRYVVGFVIGVALIALTVWPAFLTEEVIWKGFTPVVALFFIAFIIQGASEEVLFRGALMSAISRKMGIFLGGGAVVRIVCVDALHHHHKFPRRADAFHNGGADGAADGPYEQPVGGVRPAHGMELCDRPARAGQRGRS